MSVSANQVNVRQCDESVHAPLAASTTLYEGTLAFVNTSGYLVGTTGSGVNRPAGVLKKGADNSAGNAGDVVGELWQEGIFEFAGSGFNQASVGKDAYATDNFTVAAGYAANGVRIGKIVEYISATKVAVALDPQAWRQGAVVAVGAGLKMACGEGTLDGTNPTTITTGLTTVVAFTTTLKGSTAPGDNTSVLTANISDGDVDVYAWKNTGGSDPTLVASTGTESFYWIAVGQ